MKKLFLYLFLFLMMTPFHVKANNTPIYDKYKVVVTNPEGAKVYYGEYEWYGNVEVTQSVDIVPFDEILEINGEYSDKLGNIYGAIVNDDNFTPVERENPSDPGRIVYYVNLNDVAVVKSTKDIEDEDVVRVKRDLYTYKDVKLSAGPAVKYDVVTIIPKGTNLHSEYATRDSRKWAYVEYEGYKGWVFIYDDPGFFDSLMYEGVVVVDNKVIYALRDKKIKFYDLPNLKSSFKEKSIEANSMLTAKYSTFYYEEMQVGMYKLEGNWLYVDDQEYKGWVLSNYIYSDSYCKNTDIYKYKDRDGVILSKQSGEILTLEDELIVYYDYLDMWNREENTEKGVTLSVNSGTKLKVSYLDSFGFPVAYYIEYDGKFYWVNAKNNKIAFSKNLDTYHSHGPSRIKTLKKVNIYENPLSNKIIGSLEEGTIIDNITYMYESWVYDDTVKGWLYIGESKDLEIENYEDIVDSDIDDAEKTIILKNNSKKTVLYVTIGVVVLSIITVITIYLFNKKIIKIRFKK